MKRRNSLFGVLAIMVWVMLSCSDDKNSEPVCPGVSGTWEGTYAMYDAPNEPHVLRLVLTGEGASLTGTLTLHEGQDSWGFSVLGCVVECADIGFRIDEKQDIPEEETEYWNFIGSIVDGEMSGTFESEGTESERGTWSATKR